MTLNAWQNQTASCCVAQADLELEAIGVHPQHLSYECCVYHRTLVTGVEPKVSGLLGQRRIVECSVPTSPHPALIFLKTASLNLAGQQVGSWSS